jgi:flagellar biosynthesis protein FlhF
VLLAAGVSTRLAAVYDAVMALQRADVPADWISSFCSALLDGREPAGVTTEVVQSELAKQLADMIDPDFSLEPGDRVLVTGPSGAGKTSVIGKLASSLVMVHKKPVSLVSLDSSKVGAMDEIESYGDLLGVSVQNPSSLTDLSDQGDAATRKKVITLIDTGALSSDSIRLGEQVNEYVKTGSTHRLVVFSATMRTSDLQAFCGKVAALKPTHLVMTGADLTGRWGGIMAAVKASGAKLALVTDAPSGAGKLMSPEIERITRALMTGEVARG